MEQLWKPRRVAALLGVGRHVPYRLAQYGTLPAFKLTGRTLRFRANDVLRYKGEPTLPAPEQKDVYGVSELAGLLDVTKPMVYKLLGSGALSAVKTTSQKWDSMLAMGVAREEIEEWVRSSRIGPRQKA